MTLLQRYFWRQALVPLLISLTALAALALLTQSLSTLDLIVENRQSALTFFYITILALPQLIAIIMPLAVFMAVLYAMNRLNMDSELVVAKASGVSPWQITNPALRLATLALIAHLIVNLALQPYSFRKMRQALFEVRTDIASQIVRPGEFISPTQGLTMYAREVLPNGQMQDVLIYDERDQASPLTYIAKEGYLLRTDNRARLVLLSASYQQVQSDNSLRVLEVDRDEIDLSEVLALDSVMRLKPSDRYIHELLRPNTRTYISKTQRDVLAAEGHARLSAPLYNIALTLLALSFLVRGQYKRMGYGKHIAVCATLGFTIRLAGFAVASAAEKDTSLNALQYIVPITVSVLCLWFLVNRKRATKLYHMLRPVPLIKPA